jgi:hypothetical protein
MPLDAAVQAQPIVTLNRIELSIALTIGGQRQIENVLKERQDAYGADPDRGWQG